MFKIGVILGKELKKFRGKCNWDKSDYKRFGIKKKSKCIVWFLNIIIEFRNYLLYYYVCFFVVGI